jgi:hypothetical protein
MFLIIEEGPIHLIPEVWKIALSYYLSSNMMCIAREFFSGNSTSHINDMVIDQFIIRGKGQYDANGFPYLVCESVLVPDTSCEFFWPIIFENLKMIDLVKWGLSENCKLPHHHVLIQCIYSFNRGNKTRFWNVPTCQLAKYQLKFGRFKILNNASVRASASASVSMFNLKMKEYEEWKLMDKLSKDNGWSGCFLPLHFE